MKANNLSLQKIFLIFGVSISIIFLSSLLFRLKLFLSNPFDLSIGLIDTHVKINFVNTVTIKSLDGYEKSSKFY